MSPVLEVDQQTQKWLNDDISPEMLSSPLPGITASVVVDLLKAEADRYWFIDPNHSLQLAERIIAIGHARHDVSQEALGLMAKGDSLRFLVRVTEAWDALERAGNLFQEAGDEVGWARTRIGLLDLGMKLKRMEETFADAKRARAIFERYGERERVLRLDFQTAIVHNYLGNQQQALQMFASVFKLAEELGDAGRKYLGQLHLNIGFTYDALGDFRQALQHYESARGYMVNADETRNLALLDINIAYIAQAQGHYRHALDILYSVLARIGDRLPEEALWANCDLIECYLYLNRYEEARDLARKIVAEYRTSHDAYEYARALLHLTIAEAELGDFTAAHKALRKAQKIFTSLDAKRWKFTTLLWHGRISLKEEDAQTSYEKAVKAEAFFKSSGQHVNYATAILLKGQSQFVLRNFEEASDAGVAALRFAQQVGLPSLRYSAHLLLGQIREAQSQHMRACRHYQAATAAIERVQRRLSITLRPGFLEKKSEALHALMALFLRSGQFRKAFETLERAKSQVLLGYLANQEYLHWTKHDDRSWVLIEELNRLRDEHQWYSRLLQDLPRNPEYPSVIDPDRALGEIMKREKRMRSIIEQLYLHNPDADGVNPAPTPSLNEIQHLVNDESLLIEFYNDGSRLWVFVLDGNVLEARCLSVTMEELNQSLMKLHSNMESALQVDPHAPYAPQLTAAAQSILQRIYSGLLEPLELHRWNRKRLVIVPYGALHYLPFHLLHDHVDYLIEQYEVVILPASGLITRSVPRRKPGALILANSQNGKLPHTLAEAKMVQGFFGGRLYTEDLARRAALQADPAQILHIAAHGHHRLDQPDLSYLQLADGQLYTDDLLQQDLSYELVTLSGCETGRANVVAGDELIGLGRGFLYAGAGALIASLWPVVDDATLHFMERMYRALQAGTSKSAAIREAQVSILAENRELHPVFWGAFQLIGDACPLSK